MNRGCDFERDGGMPCSLSLWLPFGSDSDWRRLWEKQGPEMLVALTSELSEASYRRCPAGGALWAAALSCLCSPIVCSFLFVLFPFSCVHRLSPHRILISTILHLWASDLILLKMGSKSFLNIYKSIQINIPLANNLFYQKFLGILALSCAIIHS